jgi:hypothetical protein
VLLVAAVMDRSDGPPITAAFRHLNIASIIASAWLEAIGDALLGASPAMV